MTASIRSPSLLPQKGHGSRSSRQGPQWPSCSEPYQFWGILIQGPWFLKQFAVPAWSFVIDVTVTRLLSLGHMVALLSPLPFPPSQLGWHSPCSLRHQTRF